MDKVSTVSEAVAQLYNTYPFPPEPFLDRPPPGYNWRWHWQAAYSFCSGHKPNRDHVRVLDAGCGTGVGTEYLVHLNPKAEVLGIDLSDRAIATARERCRRSAAARVDFQALSLYAADQLPGQFDWINCVGVLHHLPDPIRGIQSLAAKLAPGGIFHIFVYAALGRWEINLMQQAIALLQGPKRGDYRDGVTLGRQLFASLPDTNRLKRREQERWSLENQRDECFADMYLHPQEVDYTIDTLFELIDASGLQFVGFSNPAYWNLERLLGNQPDLLARVAPLNERQRYRLIELLDPEITHYEFFLAKPPLGHSNWNDDDTLLQAKPERHPCMEGWPSRSIFDCDYRIVDLSEAEYDFLQACEAASGQETVEYLLRSHPLPLETVRSLQRRQLILLSTSGQS
ncbi:class I SAM-dependent methyltransferase [Halomicronema hongdechloris]